MPIVQVEEGEWEEVSHWLPRRRSLVEVEVSAEASR
jgi:hypothetical protein